MTSKQTQCKRGHEFTEENTSINIQGSRVCKACQAYRMSQYRLRNPRDKKGHRNIHKTHCPQGHEYTEENTYVSRNKRHCKQCAAARHTEIRFKKYGVTKHWYEDKLKEQQNCCGICNREFVSSPHIDHNHETGDVRGLLCYSCNSAIGKFQDNPEILQNAIDYLAKFSKTITL
jgi:hypothetical protein